MMALDLGGNWHKELQRLELSQFLTTQQIWEVLPPFEAEPVTKMDLAKLYKDLNVFNPKAGPVLFALRSYQQQSCLPLIFLW